MKTLILSILALATLVTQAAPPPPAPIRGNPFTTNINGQTITNSSPLYQTNAPITVVGGSGPITNEWGGPNVVQQIGGYIKTTSALNLELNIRSFGAALNGVTPDDDAIDACQNALIASGGGTMIIPIGTTTISRPISVTSNAEFTIKGESTFNSIQTDKPGSVIRLADGANCDMLVKSAGGRLNIKGLIFDGNRANQTATNLHGIWLRGLPDPTERVTIEDIVIQSINGTGLQVDNRETHVYRIHVRDCLAHGIVDTASSDCSYNNILVGFNYGNGVMFDGVPGTGSNSKYINYGNIFRNGMNGLVLTNASNNTMIGVKVDANNENGILITGDSLRNRFIACLPVVNNYPFWVDQTPSPIASGTYSNVKLAGTNVYDVGFTACQTYEYESLLNLLYSYRPRYLIEDARTTYYTNFNRVSLTDTLLTEASTFWTVNYANPSIRTNASGIWILDGVPQHKNNDYWDVILAAKIRAQDQLEGAVGFQMNSYFSDGWKYRSNGPAFYLSGRFDDPVFKLMYAPSNAANASLTWATGFTMDSTNGTFAFNKGNQTAVAGAAVEVNGKIKGENFEIRDGVSANAYFSGGGWLRREGGSAYLTQSSPETPSFVISVAPSNSVPDSVISFLPGLSINDTTGFVSIPQGLILPSTPPASAAAAGTTGQITWDSDFVYVYVGGGWKRAALSTW